MLVHAPKFAGCPEPTSTSATGFGLSGCRLNSGLQTFGDIPQALSWPNRVCRSPHMPLKASGKQARNPVSAIGPVEVPQWLYPADLSAKRQFLDRGGLQDSQDAGRELSGSN